MAYIDDLKNPKWQKKRLEIYSRDKFKCMLCGDTETTLNVHHIVYKKEYKKPWEYPNNLLITLCESCHKEEKEYKGVITEMISIMFLLLKNTDDDLYTFYHNLKTETSYIQYKMKCDDIAALKLAVKNYLIDNKLEYVNYKN